MRVLLVIAILQTTTAFLTAGGQCFDVCDCPLSSYQTDIDCTRRDLQTVPVFDLSPGFVLTAPHRQLHLRLDDNKITEIPFGVFRNFTNFQGYGSVQIFLDRNLISNIHNGAFLGLENLTLELYLRDNSLTTISHEFARFRGLRELRIESNPLTATGISDDVIRQLFDNNAIRTIGISSNDLLKKVMRYQHNTIENMYLFGIDETRFLPGTFLKGHHTSLKMLEIMFCGYEDFSEPLCNLDIESFIVSSSGSVHDTTLQGCPQNNTKYLSIINCLTTDALDPSAFYSAPLQQLTLWGTMQHVPRQMLMHWPNIDWIELKGQIQSIQKDDFEGLTKLTTLRLFENQISVVDDDAFNTNIELNFVWFRQTDALTHLPQSLKNRTHLNSLLLPDMTCSCATMGNLKGGNFASVSVSGDCNNIPGTSIASYLNNDVNACI